MQCTAAAPHRHAQHGRKGSRETMAHNGTECTVQRGARSRERRWAEQRARAAAVDHSARHAAPHSTPLSCRSLCVRCVRRRHTHLPTALSQQRSTTVRLSTPLHASDSMATSASARSASGSGVSVSVSAASVWLSFLSANRPSSLSKWQMIEKAAVLGFIIMAMNQLRKVKLKHLISAIPGASGALSSRIDNETREAVAGAFPASLATPSSICIPAVPDSYESILARMGSFQQHEPKRGRVFGYMYETEDHALEQFVQKAFTMYMHENGLNPTAFPALRKFEVEVVQMTLNLFNAPPKAVGTMTSGGTESLLLAIKTYRDRARVLTPHITKPEAIMCHSVHVAVPKACKYFDVTPVFVSMDSAMRMDVDEARRAVSRNTIVLIASAPQYPHGVVDPVVEVAALALEHNLPCHVDACMGGFLLPWVERLGFPVPLWDFRVPGVTSISADVHKYGYAAKGASTISWISQEYRQFQFFAFAQWPGGMFVSPSMLGTRPGGAIAAAWAALVGIGEAGYLSKAKALMATSHAFQAGINSIPELRVLGSPNMSIVSWTAKDEFARRLNIFAVADVLDKQHGFKVECQQNPTCLHVTLTPPHAAVVNEFVQALRSSVAYALAHPELVKEGSAATYGLIAQIPSDAIVDQFLVAYLDKVLQPTPGADHTNINSTQGQQ